jgi:hypothetical protein
METAESGLEGMDDISFEVEETSFSFDLQGASSAPLNHSLLTFFSKLPCGSRLRAIHRPDPGGI